MSIRAGEGRIYPGDVRLAEGLPSWGRLGAERRVTVEELS